jgi:hypothetical protein
MAVTVATAYGAYAPRMKAITESLAPLPVLDLEGHAVPLGTLWRDRPQVVVWLRHFG